MIDPNNPPIELNVEQKVFRSSLPLSGYFLAMMTIIESTTTSVNDTEIFERNSIHTAMVSDS